ncbi:MAG: DUF6398 domain-containing protein, partial [Hyphomicrobiaceae bacterium]|nr:DUF6398 domain-containing protein [Hyphomicrobiaceae bacterium]
MAKQKKSTRVPKAQRETYDRLTALSDEFCQQHLHEDYAELARYAIAALSRKRPSPLRSGRPNTWVCGVIYALGQVNFLFDKDSNPHMSAADLCAHFNIATSTGSAKVRQINKALGMDRFDFTWALPEVIDRFTMYWMIQVNGLLVDARNMPREVQEEAFERGMIPYVHADKEKSQTQLARRKKILARY